LRPTVVWDGAAFIVAWDDQRNQESFFDARTDVYAARVSETGAVIDTTAFAVDSGEQARASPALLPRQGRSTLVAAARFTVTSGFDSYRVGLASIGEDGCPADFDAFVRAFEAGC
jgi:hypothetical protein